MTAAARNGAICLEAALEACMVGDGLEKQRVRT